MKKALPALLSKFFLTQCERDVVEYEPIPVDKVIRYSQDIQPLFDDDCVNCHESFDPDLSYDTSYFNLINTAPVFCSDYTSFVDTNQPATSLLYVKLLANPPCGNIMPSTP